MRTKGTVIGIIILVLVVFISGCDMDFKQLAAFARPDTKNELIMVEIVFTDGQGLTTYVSSLGINDQSKVFVGGSSVNYFYDQYGNILGSYNYQRVLYMKIVSKEDLET